MWGDGRVCGVTDATPLGDLCHSSPRGVASVPVSERGRDRARARARERDLGCPQRRLRWKRTRRREERVQTEGR